MRVITTNATVAVVIIAVILTLTSSASSQDLPDLPELKLPPQLTIGLPGESDCQDYVYYAGKGERVPAWLLSSNNNTFKCSAYVITPSRFRWLLLKAEREDYYRNLIEVSHAARANERQLLQRHVQLELERAQAWQHAWSNMVNEVHNRESLAERRSYWRGVLLGAAIGGAGAMAIVILAD